MKTVQSREDFLKELKELLPRDCSVAEIGVLHGDFSEKILEILEPETLALIDPYAISESKYGEALNNLPTAYSTEDDYKNLLQRFDDRIKSEQVIVSRDYSYKAVKDFPDNGFDLVYLDGSHSYFDVQKDLKDWLPKIKERGFIGGHDFIQHSSFGVVQAVFDFMIDHNFKMILLNENGGDFALKRI